MLSEGGNSRTSNTHSGGCTVGRRCSRGRLNLRLGECLEEKKASVFLSAMVTVMEALVKEGASATEKETSDEVLAVEEEEQG